ncbi:MAG: dihydropyrimidinase [Hyphomicrobiales bacterium]|jgi:dihydropyrimidinase|nr:dihydropyrimidinase [Hyphomicrobiales bacterium]
MQPFDLVIRGGTVATAADSFKADVGIRGATVAAIGEGLDRGKKEIDARGKLVLPGGVDAHGHIEQLSASGKMNADTFESATTAAAHGGTTTVISFAAQHVGMSLKTVVDEYHELAERGAVVDYAFHMILADPREEVLEKEVPPLVKAGHSSLKVFMTYDRLKVDDEQLLNVLQAARDNKAMVCVHAENHGMISWLGKRLLKHGYTAPKFHGIAHPRLCEPEAFHRLIACAALVDQPIMIFHVSTAEGAQVIRHHRGEGLKIFAETCPQYLFLTKEKLDVPGVEGRKWMFSPPARNASDQEALWQALALGDLQLISSDHAPYAFNETGKLMGGKSATFKQVPNGMPGYEGRLPMVFNEMVSNGRFDVTKFVAWTSTNPAKIYNLYPRKGTLAIGSDADVAIWDPKKSVTFSDKMVKDKAGYTPWKGRTVKGWPTTVLLRGEVLVADGKLKARPGSGQFLARAGGAAAEPLGRATQEFDPKRNFGAKLR